MTKEELISKRKKDVKIIVLGAAALAAAVYMHKHHKGLPGLVNLLKGAGALSIVIGGIMVYSSSKEIQAISKA